MTQVLSAAEKRKRRLIVVLTLTSVYLAAEVIGGLLTHSLALLADAGHMFTDTAGLALALFAITFAERPATPERTYGFYRVEILAALLNALVLIGISFYILYEAYERFKNPPKVSTGPMLVVALIGLAVNIVGMLLLRDASAESLNMKGAYFELLSDMLGSIGVIVAAMIMWTTKWYHADPIISAAIGLFILPRTWKLLRDAIGILLEGTPSDVNLPSLRQAIAGIGGVAGVHDLHVWSLTSGVNALSVHVVRRDGIDHDEILTSVRQTLTSQFRMAHTTIQVEGIGCEENEKHL